MLRAEARTAKIPEAPIQKLLSTARIPENTVSLGQGVPFFPPPREVVAALMESADDGFRYSEDAGLLGLRNTIIQKLRNENGIRCSTESIIVTAGGNQAFVNALLAITNVGDEIVLVAPYYFNHLMAIKMAGCKPKIVEAGKEFLPDVREIEKKITNHTRAVVTVSPNNPAGVVYPPRLLAEINRACAKHGIYHVSDEAYEHFVFDGAVHLSPASRDKNLEHTITLFSFSKSFGMGGYRVGYMVFPQPLFPEILKVQDTIGICPPVPSQHAAEAALKIGKKHPEKYLPRMEKVRKIFLEELEKLDLLLSSSNGAFYLYLRIPEKSGKKINDWKLGIHLIEKFGVIALPASIFGDRYPGFRLSFGNVDEETGQEGIRRFVKGLVSLCPWVR
ncbi:MAG: aminotransferase class I/II-fold pyridoxal phosphate-dependent enzyme [Thermoplasmata archaeon]|nr:aminotransferase class I/II-fold pyridoxal phosphate-dependent enzyme [Thermoplasmata archaeon]